MRSSSSIVFAIVSQIVHPCRSGVARRPDLASWSSASSSCPRVSSEFLRELAGVQEVDLARLEPRLRERRLDRHEVRST